MKLLLVVYVGCLAQKTLMLTQGKERFGIARASIAVGEQADMTLFSPDGTATVTKESIQSSVTNSAYLGKEMKGTILGLSTTTSTFKINIDWLYLNIYSPTQKRYIRQNTFAVVVAWLWAMKTTCFFC